MSTTTYSDLATADRYLPEIVTFIQTLVHAESAAVVIACEVFLQHQKKEKRKPFISEELRLNWLHTKSRRLAAIYLKRKRHEMVGSVLREVLHDCQ